MLATEGVVSIPICSAQGSVAAVTSHLRKRDLLPAHLFPGVVMLVVATAALALRLS